MNFLSSMSFSASTSSNSSTTGAYATPPPIYDPAASSASWLLSAFGKTITSPKMATFVIGSGKTKTELHLHEEVLRNAQIPFFQNTLQGLPPGTAMRVLMPDENPEIVSKMIEFMYKGDYSAPTTSERESTAAHLEASFLSRAMGNDEPPSMTRRSTIPAHKIKLFHAQVYVLAERYGYKALCKLSQTYVFKNLIFNGPDFLDYIVEVYEMTGPGSAMRIPNLVQNGEVKFRHGTAWAPHNMRDWVSKWWLHDGGVLGANEGQGKMLDAFERSPELARDLLVLVSEVLHSDR